MTEQGESNANRANARRSSVPLFDPVAGMRAMADIQAEGLRAASDLLERVLEPDRRAPAELSPSRSPWSERDYAGLVDSWVELLQRVSAGLAPPGDAGRVTVSVDSAAVSPPVRLVLEGPEQVDGSAGEVWLHNGTSAAVGPLALRCGALSAAGGEVLDARVRFDPVEVPLLPPRSSRGVVISVLAVGEPRPGVYRGTIQTEGAPAMWLPLEVAVR
jgi:hypothetical protein